MRLFLASFILLALAAFGQPLKQSTAVTVTVGPFVDFADGKTILADNNDFDPNDIVCRLVKTGSESTLTLTKSGGSHNINLTGYGMATLTLTAADVSSPGGLLLFFCDRKVENYYTETILPFAETFTVYPSAVYDLFFTAETDDTLAAIVNALIQDVNDLSLHIDKIPTKPSRPSIGGR